MILNRWAHRIARLYALCKTLALEQFEPLYNQLSNLLPDWLKLCLSIGEISGGFLEKHVVRSYLTERCTSTTLLKFSDYILRVLIAPTGDGHNFTFICQGARTLLFVCALENDLGIQLWRNFAHGSVIQKLLNSYFSRAPPWASAWFWSLAIAPEVHLHCVLHTGGAWARYCVRA